MAWEFPLTLTTARLTLRELSLDDCSDAQRLDSDPEVVRYQSGGIRDEAATLAYLARNLAAAQVSPRAVFDLAITWTGDDRFIGRTGFHVQRPEHRDAMLWFTLRRDLWGQGIVTEAATAVLDHAFEVVGLHRVWGDCDPRNLASARVMEKLGLRREAHHRENWWLEGEWCDSLIYAVLEHEWRELRRSPGAGAQG